VDVFHRWERLTITMIDTDDIIQLTREAIDGGGSHVASTPEVEQLRSELADAVAQLRSDHGHEPLFHIGVPNEIPKPDSAPSGITPRLMTKAYNPDEARGQPQNAGEWVAGAGSSSPKQKNPLPISMAPTTTDPGLISPHNANTVKTSHKDKVTGKNVKGSRPAIVNWGATQLSRLTPALRDKIIKRVLTYSPNKLTAKKMDAQLYKVWQSAQSDPVALKGKHWYNHAHDIANDIANNTGKSLRQAVGFLAALSPQTNWYTNEATANFCSKALKEDKPLQLSKDTLDYYTPMAKNNKRAYLRAAIPVGKKLSEMTPNEAAWSLLGLMKDADLRMDEPNVTGSKYKASPTFGTANLAKAIQIYRGTGPNGENWDPDKVLGGHKIRSFFNNILDPDDTAGHHDVTIDTHAVCAATGYRMGSKSMTLTLMFSRGSSIPENTAGTYAMFADGYRRLTDRLNAEGKEHYTPNQVQAIIWTHWQTSTDKKTHVGMREEFPEVPGEGDDD
jgi:hypothetical protein